MRAHTSLRTAFRMGFTMAAGLGVALTANAAHADVEVGGSGGSRGGETTSTGTAELKYEHTEALDTTIDTGFKEVTLFGQTVGVRGLVAIEPVKDGGPLYTIDMPKGALVEASWGNDKKFVFRTATGARADGVMKVRHSLAPTVQFRIKLSEQFGGATTTMTFDASSLVTKLPGSRFAYDSAAQQEFAPWGFQGVETVLSAPNLDAARLLALNFSQLPEAVANKVKGDFSINATTKPTFSYRTTKVYLNGAGELSDAGDEITMDAQDGDYLDLMANAEGEVTASGELQLRPRVKVTEALGYNIPDIDVEIPKGVDTPYTITANTVVFQSVLVHIPLPNVKAPTKGVDLGAVKAGSSATSTITIENTGEMAATMRFDSSDAQFTVPEGSVTVPPKGSYDLVVQANLETSGPALSEIRVLSNDPDSPEQMFKIGANGADVGADDELLPGAGPGVDSGCGCKTAGSTSTLPSWAGMGLAGLGALVFARRRKTG
jgi:MYXO-CTERM domain-containing protein